MSRTKADRDEDERIQRDLRRELEGQFEPKPRWKGAPQICAIENLPAFKTKEKLLEFHSRNSPSCLIHEIWLCEACKHYHADTSAPDPAGGSSGTGRHIKMDVAARIEQRKARTAKPMRPEPAMDQPAKRVSVELLIDGMRKAVQKEP